MPLYQSKFGLGSVADLSNTGVRNPTSTERATYLPTWKAMRFVRMVSIRIMVIFRCLLFLMDRHHPYSLVTIVFWLIIWFLLLTCVRSYLLNLVKVAVDPLLESSAYFNPPLLYPMFSIVIRLFESYDTLLRRDCYP